MKQPLLYIMHLAKKYWIKIALASIFAILITLIMRMAIQEDRIHQIQGLVTDVNFLPAEGFGSSDYTIIKFEDGRTKTFPEINNALVFQRGKVHIVKYKTAGIISIEVK